MSTENSLPKERGFLNRNALKYFALFCMVCDHVGVAFFDSGTLWYIVLKFLGGFTMPIMAFFLAEGYCYTHNVKRYALRIFVFTFISIVPFCYLQSGGSWLPFGIADGTVNPRVMNIYFSGLGKTVYIYRLNFLFTLLLSLANIAAWDKLKAPAPIKVVITVLICWLATGCDWGYWCVLFSFIFWKFREKPTLKWILYSLVSLTCVFYFKVFQNPLCFEITYLFKPIHFNLFLVIPIIALCYNGTKGKTGKFSKWFFYIFYPAHLLIIDLILFFASGR